MIGKVLESSAVEIIIRMEFEDFEKNKENLKIGRYIKIAVGNLDSMIASKVLRQLRMPMAMRNI